LRVCVWGCVQILTEEGIVAQRRKGHMASEAEAIAYAPDSSSNSITGGKKSTAGREPARRSLVGGRPVTQRAFPTLTRKSVSQE
jgi:hypothetical protein